MRVALLAEGVDRNYKRLRKYEKAPWSPSSRRAWIEIGCSQCIHAYSGSPSSRRAWIEISGGHPGCCGSLVALLAEGVDRNCVVVAVVPTVQRSPSSRRAWIEITEFGSARKSNRSPSSRRAWIEISKLPLRSSNFVSPSSRRAWIEITPTRLPWPTVTVALLAEGVDRNSFLRARITPSRRRPPRGGRG